MADVIIENPSGNSNLDGATIKNIASEKTLDEIKNLADRIERHLGQSGLINRTLKTIAENTKISSVDSRADFEQLVKSSTKLTNSFDVLRISVEKATSSLTSGFRQLNSSLEESIQKLMTLKVGLSLPTRDSGKLGNEIKLLNDSTNKVIRSFDILKSTAIKLARSMHSGLRGGSFDGGRGGGRADDEKENELSAAGDASGAAALLSQFHLLKKFSKLHPAVTAVYVGFQALSSVVGAVIKMFTGFVVSGIKMINQFVQGENKLSAYVNTLAEAVSSIPLIGGLLGGLVGIIAETIKTLEHWRDVQTQLADVGAAFNQDLYTMRLSAERTGLDLDKFAGIVSKNSENLSKFGTVTTGALQFTKVVKSLRTEMQGMGYSLEDVNEGVAQTFGLLSTGLATRTVAEHELTEASRTLMKEFDAVAKLTGRSRKSQEELIKKQTMNAAFQLKLSRLSKEEQSRINAAMVRLGEEAADDFKTHFLGMPPLIKSVAGFRIFAGDASRAMGEFAKDLESGSVAPEEFEKRVDKLQVIVAKSSINAATNLETILSAGAAGLNSSVFDYTKSIDAITVSNRKYMANGIYDEAAHLEDLKKMRKEQAARDKVATSLNAFEKLINELRISLYEYIIKPLYDIMGPMLKSFARDFGDVWAPKIKKFFENFGEKLLNFTDELSVLFEGNKIQNTFIDGFEMLIQRVSIEISRIVGQSTLAKVLGFGFNEKEYQNELNLWRSTIAAKKEEYNDLVKIQKNKRLSDQLQLDKNRKEKLTKEREEKLAEIEKLKLENTDEAKTKLEELNTQVQNLNQTIEQVSEKIKTNSEIIDPSNARMSEETVKAKEKEIELAKEVDKQSKWSRAYNRGILGLTGGAAVGAGVGSLAGGIGAAPGALAGGILGGLGGALQGFFGYETKADKLAENLSLDKLSKEEQIKKLAEINSKIETFKQNLTPEQADQVDFSQLIALEKQGAYLKKMLDYDKVYEQQKEANNKYTENTNEITKLKKQLENTSKTDVETRNRLNLKIEKLTKENQTNSDELNKLTQTIIDFEFNIASPLSKYKIQGAKNAGQGLAVDLDSEKTAQAASNRFKQLQQKLGAGSIKQVESVAGGPIEENTVRVAQGLSQYGMFTAFNDAYHKNDKNSRHPEGKAFDMVLKPIPDLPEYIKWKSTNPRGSWDEFLKTEQATNWMQSIVNQASGDIETKIINEYDPKQRSNKTTGGHLHVELRRLGSIGSTGRAFENFGSATPAILHGVEGVFTPSQLKMIVTDSQTKLSNSFTNNIKQLLDNKNQTQLENITNIFDKTMAESASTSKKLLETVQSHREETSQMKTLLSDMLSALNKSNNHLNNIARTV